MTLRLQIAEDEPLARRAMLHSIDFAAHGFEVVAVSEDGRQAIAHFDTFAPDLVITDINMPYVSGLDVAKHIADSGKNTRVVILTGYDEFDFAQKAIQYGVSNYLLKPVTAKEFGAYLDAEREAIVLSRKRRTEQEAAQRRLYASRPVLRNEYLSRLVQGTIQADRSEQGISLADIRFAQVALFRVDDFQATATKLNMSWDLLLFAIFNVLTELADAHAACHSFQLPDADFGYLWLTSAEAELPDALAALARQTVQTLQHVGIDTHFGVGDLVNAAGDIRRSYEEARHALETNRSGAQTTPRLVADALRLIDSHYSKSDLSLLEVTTRLAVSISHFTNTFKEHTGKTFVEYLTQVRIEKAKETLINTDLMLYRIASDVGYDNPTYFASIFKKTVGITPKQFRNLYSKSPR